MAQYFQDIIDFFAKLFSPIITAVQFIGNVFSVVGNFFTGLFASVSYSPLVVFLTAAFGLLLVAAIVILVIRLL